MRKWMGLWTVSLGTQEDEKCEHGYLGGQSGRLLAIPQNLSLHNFMAIHLEVTFSSPQWNVSRSNTCILKENCILAKKTSLALALPVNWSTATLASQIPPRALPISTSIYSMANTAEKKRRNLGSPMTPSFVIPYHPGLNWLKCYLKLTILIQLLYFWVPLLQQLSLCHS